MTLCRINRCMSLIATPALAIGLALAAIPAGACDRADCIAVASAKTSKPLNLNQFMRPPAAKKKTGSVITRRDRGLPASRTQRAQPTTAAVPLPPSPAEAVTADTAQSDSLVPVVSSRELNTLDRAAGPVLAETVGAGAGSKWPVQQVATTDFNEIDRMAEASRPDSEPAGTSSEVSWIQRFWSALRGALDTVAEAFRQLIG